MASELNVLARDAARVARSNPRTADFTHNILQRGAAARSSPASRSIAPTSTDRHADRDATGATSTGRWRRRGATRRGSTPACSISCTALLTGDLVAEPRSGFSRHAVLALRDARPAI